MAKHTQAKKGTSKFQNIGGMSQHSHCLSVTLPRAYEKGKTNMRCELQLTVLYPQLIQQWQPVVVSGSANLSHEFGRVFTTWTLPVALFPRH
jgi:hypothetical protein